MAGLIRRVSKIRVSLVTMSIYVVKGHVYVYIKLCVTILNRNSLCRWNIVAGTGTVKFEILFSDMVSGEECYSDTLEIFDGTVQMFCCLLSAHLNQSLVPSRDKPAFCFIKAQTDKALH